jgi:hypothetical protein
MSPSSFSQPPNAFASASARAVMYLSHASPDLPATTLCAAYDSPTDEDEGKAVYVHGRWKFDLAD